VIHSVLNSAVVPAVVVMQAVCEAGPAVGHDTTPGDHVQDLALELVLANVEVTTVVLQNAVGRQARVDSSVPEGVAHGRRGVVTVGKRKHEGLRARPGPCTGSPVGRLVSCRTVPT
jgi:hypothetical protein